ncbi:CPXCG motif-containing cysteine-rich protein [Nitrosococcus watsonii]|uniref:CPXCG motif-containing cysteine-rich protein n=1 Tax=Nitrosococcus watsoni (strain C-113) TaxID=105559 RepID=D8K721_NITWC|nr:CPXCG motif-containing cysteine-rich protein [Nitrosococcus watsonii]ADJ28698.1 conserved hypothetical protein [Nitrosococcus watsonii C-113]
MTEPVTVLCPYCGASFETMADCSAGNQTYYEDCTLCCHPILFHLKVDENGKLLHLETLRDDE